MSCLSGSRNYVLDSSFLIYHYYKADSATSDILKGGFLNHVSLSEALYILCRKEGITTTLDFIREILKVIKVVPSERIVLIAGQFKCKYPIALADCWVLATSKVLEAPALFAFKEKELLAHVDAIREEVKVEFLEEILKNWKSC